MILCFAAACTGEPATNEHPQQVGIDADGTATPISSTQSVAATQLAGAPQVQLPTSVPSDRPTLQATPSVSKWRITDDVLFGPSLEPGCELPCWQGLVIGESEPQDIEAVFDEVFGFNGNHEFFSESRPRDTNNSLGLPGVYAASYHWIFREQTIEHPLQAFAIIFWLDSDTDTLLAIHLNSFSWSQFNSLMSPQRIIRELGTPSHMLMELAITGPDYGQFHLVMVYDKGIVYDGTIFVPVTFTSSSQVNVDVCMGGERWGIVEEYISMPSRDAYIIEPLADGLNDLSPLQHQIIFGRIGSNYVPLEEYFNTSLSEVTDLALQETDACLHGQVNYE
jgi:hypothetical protein